IGVGGTGVTTTYSDFADGDGQWALLSVEYTLTDSDTDLYILCETAISATALYGLGWAYIDKLYKYPLPKGMNRPAFVSMQDIETRPTGKFVPLNDTNPRTGAMLRLEGKRPLPQLQTSSDVLPLDDRYVGLLVEKASGILLGNAAARTTGDGHDRLVALEQKHLDRYTAMIQDPQKRMPRLGAEVGKNWHIEGDMLVLEEANVGPVFSGLPSSTVTSAGIG
ncbi:hypothetical protein LCGC14_2189610, partial [marine sediment metagenome]